MCSNEYFSLSQELFLSFELFKSEMGTSFFIRLCYCFPNIFATEFIQEFNLLENKLGRLKRSENRTCYFKLNSYLTSV